jgi:peptide/nickel transport system permease protein
MSHVIFRRGRDLVVTLLLVGTLMFFVVHLLPGNPAVAMLGSYATEDQVRQLTHALGLDQPLLSQYGLWLGHVVQGNLGDSIGFQQPVTTVLAEHLGPTALLAVASTVISLVVSVPLAAYTAARPGSWWTRVLTPLSVFGIAVPNFWLALVLIIVFGVALRVLPIAGYVSPLTDLPSAVSHLILPVVVLVAGQAALFVRTLRESMLGELLALYPRTARAKGASERVVILGQLLPNALIPLLTVVGTSLGTLLGGIVIVENVFVIPGFGALLFQSINSRDYPLVEGITLAIALGYVLINLGVDLLYTAIDPRVRIR